MSTDNTQAIADAITQPASMSVDGQSMASHSIPDKIAGDKYVKANDALSNIANGGYPFVGIKFAPPGAGGDC